MNLNPSQNLKTALFFENHNCTETINIIQQNKTFGSGPSTPEGPNREASGEELRASRPPGSSHPPWHSPRTPPWLPGSKNPSSNPQPYFLGQQKFLQIEDQIQIEYLSFQPIHLQILRRRCCLSVFACDKELHSQTNFKIFWIDYNEHLQLSCFFLQKGSVSCKPFAFIFCVIVLKV